MRTLGSTHQQAGRRAAPGAVWRAHKADALEASDPLGVGAGEAELSSACPSRLGRAGVLACEWRPESDGSLGMPWIAVHCLDWVRLELLGASSPGS